MSDYRSLGAAVKLAVCDRCAVVVLDMPWARALHNHHCAAVTRVAPPRGSA